MQTSESSEQQVEINLFSSALIQQLDPAWGVHQGTLLAGSWSGRWWVVSQPVLSFRGEGTV